MGFGAIGQAVARMLADGSADSQVVAVAVRDPARSRNGLLGDAHLLSGPSGLVGLEADLVVEAAGRDSVAPWARATLGAGIDFVISSTSALADDALLGELRDLAKAHGARLIVSPGALGGVDALAAARRMGLHAVEHRIVKPAAAWAGTAAAHLCPLSALTGPTEFFSGTAREAAEQFPQNANVALTTALAGLGPERTRVTLVADPGVTQNRHEITASGEFGSLAVRIANSPLPGNPKSSAMAALSLVRVIENRGAGLVV